MVIEFVDKLTDKVPEEHEQHCLTQNPTKNVFFKKLGLSRPLFLYFHLINTVDSTYKLPMTGFKPRISGAGIDRSTNCTTTTSQNDIIFG